MISRARLRANRTNARKSTGPKTREGKTRSAQNAVKHGIRARKFGNRLTEAQLQNFTCQYFCKEMDPVLASISKDILNAQFALKNIYAERDGLFQKLEDPDKVSPQLIRKIETLDVYARRIRSLQRKFMRRHRELAALAVSGEGSASVYRAESMGGGICDDMVIIKKRAE